MYVYNLFGGSEEWARRLTASSAAHMLAGAELNTNRTNVVVLFRMFFCSIKQGVRADYFSLICCIRYLVTKEGANTVSSYSRDEVTVLT